MGADGSGNQSRGHNEELNQEGDLLYQDWGSGRRGSSARRLRINNILSNRINREIIISRGSIKLAVRWRRGRNRCRNLNSGTKVRKSHPLRSLRCR
jgi:hypothetical protein